MSKNVTFIEFEPLCKRFVKFYHDHSPKVALATNFENLYLSPNSLLNFKKVTNFVLKIGSGTNKMAAKNKSQGAKHPKYMLIGLEQESYGHFTLVVMASKLLHQ